MLSSLLLHSRHHETDPCTCRYTRQGTQHKYVDGQTVDKTEYDTKETIRRRVEKCCTSIATSILSRVSDRNRPDALEPVHEALNPRHHLALLLLLAVSLLGLLGAVVVEAAAVAEPPPHDRLPEPPDHLFHFVVLVVVAVAVLVLTVAEPLPHLLLLLVVVVVVAVEPLHDLCAFLLILMVLLLEVVAEAVVAVQAVAEHPPQHLLLPPLDRRAIVLLPLAIAVRERAIGIRLRHRLHFVPRLPELPVADELGGQGLGLAVAVEQVRVPEDAVVARPPEVAVEEAVAARVVAVAPVRGQEEEPVLLRGDILGVGGARLGGECRVGRARLVADSDDGSGLGFGFEGAAVG
uniref:Uncharacterized protein n=1 Tax=Arundo donax TaxID=35708 RepID=A0A0A8ZU74_ARUDO